MPTLEPDVSNGLAAPSIVLVPAEIASIAIVRAALGEALNERGWEQEAAQRVVLSTSEATANAVEHGSLPGELIEVLYHVGASDASVRVLDSGGTRLWEPPAAPLLPTDDDPRGRGLAIIYALARRVEIRREGLGTEVRLEFTRAA